jgi:hypothetical protein
MVKDMVVAVKYTYQKIGSITDSTFLTSANIDNIGEIVNIKALDAMAIDNYNTFSNSVLLANGSITIAVEYIIQLLVMDILVLL